MMQFIFHGPGSTCILLSAKREGVLFCRFVNGILVDDNEATDDDQCSGLGR